MTKASSPCIGVCKLDRRTGYCKGCFRTGEEIGEWKRAGRRRKLDILAALPARRAAIGALARRAWRGGCHCGNLTVAFETARKPRKELKPRACACAFCRRHGARTVSDPDGRVVLSACDPARTVAYRIDGDPTELILCGRCGTYVAAVQRDASGDRAALNVNVLEDAAAFGRKAKPIAAGDRPPEKRRARCRRKWTPLVETAAIRGEKPAADPSGRHG